MISECLDTEHGNQYLEIAKPVSAMYIQNARPQNMISNIEYELGMFGNRACKKYFKCFVSCSLSFLVDKIW